VIREAAHDADRILEPVPAGQVKNERIDTGKKSFGVVEEFTDRLPSRS
jgi:hypothetical protein